MKYKIWIQIYIALDIFFLKHTLERSYQYQKLVEIGIPSHHFWDSFIVSLEETEIRKSAKQAEKYLILALHFFKAVERTAHRAQK